MPAKIRDEFSIIKSHVMRTYYRHIRDHRCVHCGVKKKTRSRLCKKCAMKNIEIVKRNIKNKTELGFCQCGNVPAPGYKTCHRCIERNKLRYRKMKEAAEKYENEKRIEAQKKEASHG